MKKMLFVVITSMVVVNIGSIGFVYQQTKVTRDVKNDDGSLIIHVDEDAKDVMAEGNCVDNALHGISILRRRKLLDNSVQVAVSKNHCQLVKTIDGDKVFLSVVSYSQKVQKGSPDFEWGTVVLFVDTNRFIKAANDNVDLKLEHLTD